MTVKELLDLLGFDTKYELIGAKSGRRLCSSWNNKKEYIERYYDCRVTDKPIYASLMTSDRNNYTYPIVSIYVSGE